MLMILVGKSGTGKDALLRFLVARGYFTAFVSDTTRPMRDGEVDGKDYNFISKFEFQAKITSNCYIEYRAYDTLLDGVPDVWYYGTLIHDISNKDYITVVDLKGAKDLIDFYGKSNCFVVYIDTLDEIREARAIKRGSFNREEWDRRLKDDTIKFSDANLSGIVDIKRVNNKDGVIEILAYHIYRCYKRYKRGVDNVYEYRG